jgi:hypothetical protein
MARKLLTKIQFYTNISKSGKMSKSGKGRRIIIIPTKFFNQIEKIVTADKQVKVTIDDEI